jgi:hypothetical protein
VPSPLWVSADSQQGFFPDVMCPSHVSLRALPCVLESSMLERDWEAPVLSSKKLQNYRLCENQLVSTQGLCRTVTLLWNLRPARVGDAELECREWRESSIV